MAWSICYSAAAEMELNKPKKREQANKTVSTTEVSDGILRHCWLAGLYLGPHRRLHLLQRNLACWNNAEIEMVADTSRKPSSGQQV